mmetsp:Transcript_4976/g.6631  ORF Transcript_4976/g.6631 Transcript_4976/m.6631 type:complete len:107 (+) Transcript_4976:1630-1950(+)
MVMKNQNYNELKKSEIFTTLANVAQKQEDILVSLLEKFQAGSLQAKDVVLTLDVKLTKMYDDLWMATGLEEEEIFNEFFDHKCSFNARYVEGREASWRRLAQKLNS